MTYFINKYTVGDYYESLVSSFAYYNHVINCTAIISPHSLGIRRWFLPSLSSFLPSLNRMGLSPRESERRSAVHWRAGQSQVMLVKTAGCCRWCRIFWISSGLKGLLEWWSAMVPGLQYRQGRNRLGFWFGSRNKGSLDFEQPNLALVWKIQQ